MILRKEKIVFIHISKCGGTTVEKFLGGNSLITHNTNYDFALGWCPVRKIHMQHAKPSELIRHELLSHSEWESFYKFTVIRNPYERILSDYFWTKKNLKIEDSFENFVLKKGRFYNFLNRTNKPNPKYRGDHLNSLSDYFDDSLAKYDDVIELPDLTSRLTELNSEFNLSGKVTNQNKAVAKRLHYSLYFNNQSIQLINDIYTNDLQRFKYTFDDKRHLASKSEINKALKQLK